MWKAIMYDKKDAGQRVVLLIGPQYSHLLNEKVEFDDL